ncbi:hypothetical protein SERLA73DRAFT_133843 [Serpula lacrymans var. lacrymans S7.3]|uniref:Uncharacterized protein n=1 Tax=Serpula lacrymans var. lacrymans (strain S7.3) TaxID=936435 RepID=F8PSN0_SERL3|nr:hypothetical protein SERLA73DRAFT_133843 [Serpula lacrymans var. lacrymans S7.3]
MGGPWPLKRRMTLEHQPLHDNNGCHDALELPMEVCVWKEIVRYRKCQCSIQLWRTR